MAHDRPPLMLRAAGCAMSPCLRAHDSKRPLQSPVGRRLKRMAIELYWGSGSAYCWRVLLALEHKRLPYQSHRLHFDRQEHKAPQMLAMNPRGKLPVLRDADYVVFESVAVLYYLDRKYPEPPIFGVTPEEGGVIMRVVCEYQSYAEPSVMKIVDAVLERHEPRLGEDVADAMQ